jgi:hypothetical protein
MIKVLIEDPLHDINVMACTAVLALNGRVCQSFSRVRP